MQKNTAKKLHLCRYGGIGKMIKQKGNYDRKSDRTYHQAPERKGFYAFLHPFIEFFLLGSPVNVKKTETGQRLPQGRFLEAKNGTYKQFIATDGTIWTHLKPKKRSMILDEVGSWYKVRVEDMYILINQEVAKLNKSIREDDYFKTLGYKSVLSFYSKDHFEVFITKDTKINS